ncbi:uncharacterized protein TNCV_3334651 [Trichonephila clavipes]|nr:uncharacterized protein TNCV_3334651 [Trichonephila clavipes]
MQRCFSLPGLMWLVHSFSKEISRAGRGVIFTCTVYRVVHFELVTATTTEAFLIVFRRFASRRGRCSTANCNNGTNFGGADNALRLLDWKQVERQEAVNAIKWKFNPPTAACWGGWWELIIRIFKIC